jgi:hypothetical protein
MDTKKALTAIIILLILMNITLGIYLVVINSGRGNFEDTISYTKTILGNRNYRLDCNIPEETVPLSAVQLGENRFTDQSLDSVMEKTGGSAYIDDSGVMYYINSGNGALAPAGTSRTAIELAASEFISSIGINMEEFVLDYFRETGNESYNLKYVAIDENGFLYFNSFVEMQITVEGVQSARIMYPDAEVIHENQGDGIPVYTILLAGLQQTGLERTMESISSGYYSSGKGIVTANICWRIRFSDGQERFFDAATGKEIK